MTMQEVFNAGLNLGVLLGALSGVLGMSVAHFVAGLIRDDQEKRRITGKEVK